MPPVAIERVVIERGKVYPLPQFSEMSGLGARAIRSARRKGLRVRRVGRRGFVSGDDFIDYLEQHGRLSPME